MPDQNNKNLQAQIDRLEQRVEELEHRLESGSSNPKPQQKKLKEKTSAKKTADSSKASQVDRFQLGEEWLNRIGIGLLLIGVAFLFKYSIDQGWLIPPIRSSIGLAIGGVLFGWGQKMKEQEKPLKQILMGGGIAAFYITGFATFQLYSFMPGVVIWSFMIVVTLLALSLSLQQDEAVLSIVGTLGALGTPFMLHSGGGSIPMLMIYLTLVLAGASAVYMRKGWKSLLWTIAMGGFVVLCVGVIDATSNYEAVTAVQEWSLQAGTLIWVVASWILPVARKVLSFNDPHRWPDPRRFMDDGSLDENMGYKANSAIHLLIFIVPLFALVLGHGIWDFTLNQAGVASIGLAALGGGFFIPLKQQGVRKIASAHAFMGLVMLTIGIFLLLEGSYLFTVLVAEAVALRYVYYQTKDSKISISSHMLVGLLFYWLANMLFYSDGMSPLFDIKSISQLAFIASSGLLIPMWLRKVSISRGYQVVSHIMFLAWLYQKFVGFENGQAWVTVTWGAYAIILLIFGFTRYGNRLRLAGMATIFIVVGKLFLIDLSQLQAIWRILLFMGFGAVLLLLGYYSQSQWRDEREQT